MNHCTLVLTWKTLEPQQQPSHTEIQLQQQKRRPLNQSHPQETKSS